MPREARQEYENELYQWIEDACLVSYDKSIHGPVRETTPLMADVQHNKKKVHPVLDFQELNIYPDVLTAEWTFVRRKSECGAGAVRGSLS